MAGKKWLVVLGIVNVMAIAGIIFWFVSRDNTPPVISLEEENVYEETMTDEELLSGVVAIDKIDGDVSHTLVIEKVTVNQNTEKAVVSYGAMDRSGNIAKKSFQMDMKVVKPQEIPVTTDTESLDEVFTLEAGEAAIDADIGEEAVAEENPEETTEETVEEASDESQENADNEEEQNESVAAEENEAPAEELPQENTQPQVNPEENPVINFGATEVKTKKGYNPAWVTVISQLQDNKDSYEYLLQHLVIHGDFTNAELGAYDVSVSTVDSDGNESAARAIRIIVEE